MCGYLKQKYCAKKMTMRPYSYYNPFALDEVSFLASTRRVTACACAYDALFVHWLTYEHYAIAYTHNAANAQSLFKFESHSLVIGNLSNVGLSI